MATKYEETLPVPAPYPVAFDATCRALAASKMDVVHADPSSGFIMAKSSMGLASWGEDLHINVVPVGEAATNVTVRSSLKMGLVDWGKNRKNVVKLSEALSAALAQSTPTAPAPPSAPAAPAPPAGAWHPDPSGRHELRWWDGQNWTESVSDAGVPGTDSVPS